MFCCGPLPDFYEACVALLELNIEMTPKNPGICVSWQIGYGIVIKIWCMKSKTCVPSQNKDDFVVEVVVGLIFNQKKLSLFPKSFNANYCYRSTDNISYKPNESFTPISIITYGYLHTQAVQFYIKYLRYAYL